MKYRSSVSNVSQLELNSVCLLSMYYCERVSISCDWWNHIMQSFDSMKLICSSHNSNNSQNKKKKQQAKEKWSFYTHFYAKFVIKLKKISFRTQHGTGVRCCIFISGFFSQPFTSGWTYLLSAHQNGYIW